jgi:serine/threonine protein kinase/dienelactone hydrolase
METIAMLGETISHYRIIEKLGEGGMGIVFKAQDLTLDRLVALKFLPQDLIRDPEAKERFVHEAQAASALDHANICTVHEIGQHDGQTFIVMGYYEGETLKRKIEHGALPLVDAVNLICQVAEGLAKAHEAGIVHRDIKPANIIVTKDGVAKILDFGLAKVSGRTLHTKSGTTLGTVAYMSPEQARGEEIDARSDVWSLGVTMYELLAGKRPFESGYEQALVYLILNEQPEPLQKHVPDIAPEVLAIVNRALEKRPDARYSSAGEMLADLKAYQEMLRGEAFSMKTVLRWARTPKIAIPTVAVIVGITLLSVWFFNHQSRIRWARTEALPRIEKMIAESDLMRDLSTPYHAALEVEKIIPEDSRLAEAFSKCSMKINVTTDPPGAKVFRREYKAPESEWKLLGLSPLEKVRLPMEAFAWKIEKAGYDTLLAASSTFGFDSVGTPTPYDFACVLDSSGSIPPGMAHLPATNTDIGMLEDFYIDKCEVTNKQYKEFVDAGGYKTKKYWKFKFVHTGKELTWEQAMALFVDETGRHGPSNWLGGDYPSGQSAWPVSGISWYEAAAYAEFAGKSLPTDMHWRVAQGEYTPFGRFQNIFSDQVYLSNFNTTGRVPVGTLPNTTSYGVFDMAGNVREWCWNETPRGRLFRGGAWDENPYMYCTPSQMPPMDRSVENGFRCALYHHPGSIPAAAFQLVKLMEPIDIRKLKPVPDPVFQVYKEQFSYDKSPLKARVESTQENPEGWVLETISLDAAYGHERIPAYLFLPKNATPPYQTVIYFPNGDALSAPSSKDIQAYYEVPVYVSFMVKSGRAVLFPIYKGTFERGNLALSAFLVDTASWHSRQYTELFVKIIKDFKRCVDYLETRQDIDSKKLGYFGMSYGGSMGAFIPAVDDRLKVQVLLGAGLDPFGRPETNPINYVTRVKIPTKILIGEYDAVVSYEQSHEPLYELLGTPIADKELKKFPTSHVPLRSDVIRETLTWLDRYLGPVKK